MSSSQISPKTKIFPLRLPTNFHGPIKLKNKSRIHQLKEEQKQRNKLTPKQNSEIKEYNRNYLKLSAWEKRRSDLDIHQINKFYIEHPSRSSGDNPEELKSTLRFYRRSEHKYPARDRNKYTVFGNEKPQKEYSSSQHKLSYCKFYQNKPLTLNWTTPNLLNSSKISFRNEPITTLNQSSHSYLKPKEYRITEKIGSYERKFEAKSPTVLKIGHSTIIDTYNVK